MLTPKISIVIPFFNQAKFVEQCVTSALGQSYDNIEVILVNDGSDEDIDHIINKFLSHPKFNYIKQENRGTSGARNTGIRSSTGDYILPLDSDDVLPSTIIQSLVDNIVDENTILVLKARLVGTNLELSDIYYPPPGIHFRGLAELANGCSLTNSSLYSRKLFDLAGGYDETIKTVEDWEFWIRCVAAGARVKELPNTLHYLYRQHPNSISNSKRSDIQQYDAIVKEKHKHLRNKMPIDVVMMVYNRLEYFKDVVTSLENQTVEIKLHIVSNNPEHNPLFKQVLAESKLKDVEFFEADNSRITAERWFYARDHLADREFALFVDDDIVMQPNEVERIWAQREVNTMKIYQGRKYFEDQKIIDANTFFGAWGRHNEFSYGALNSGVIDLSFFTRHDLLFEMEKNYPEMCYWADDLVVSWAVTKLGGRILNHHVYPKENLGDDDKALFKQIARRPIDFTQALDSMHKFTRFPR